MAGLDFFIDHILSLADALKMRKSFVISICFLLLSSELYAWEKESGVIKSKDGNICRVYKDWVLKFDLKKTIEEPEGGPGSRIAIIKRVAKKPEISCNSTRITASIDSSERSFVGYSDGFLFLKEYKTAPGTGSVQIYDVSSGKEKMEIFTSGRPIEVKGAKVIFWEAQKELKGSECQGQETSPGLGCVLLEKVELNLKSRKKRFLGEREIDSIQ